MMIQKDCLKVEFQGLSVEIVHQVNKFTVKYMLKIYH
jgi:hypothetical protein